MAYNRPYIEHNANPMFQHPGNQPVPPNMLPGNFFNQPGHTSNNQPHLPMRHNGQNPHPMFRQNLPPYQMHGPANSMINRMPFMGEEPIMGLNMQRFGGPMQNQQRPSHFRMGGMHPNHNRFMNRPPPPQNQTHNMNIFNNVRMPHPMTGDNFPAQSFTQQSWNCPINNPTVQSGVKRTEIAAQTGQFGNVKKSQTSSTQSSDALVVESFLKKIGKHKTNSSQASSKADITSKPQGVKICEAQRFRRKADDLLGKLESINESGKLFNAESAAIYKKELDKILTTLSNEAVIKGLKKKIEQRRKRRLRIKKKKHSVYLVEKERRERIEEKHSQIEDWLKSEKVKHETQLRDNEMQRQLDEALTEVRKEQSTLNKSVDIINALDKLRKARLQTLKSSGREVPSDAMTNNFHDLVEITNKKLQSQISDVEKKSNALKMFVETEQKEVRSLLIKQKKIKEERRRKIWEDERKQHLFGKFELELDAFDPMWPVHQLHRQSQVDVNTLVEYRRQWDQFINNEGSEIPVNWVEPVQSPSEQWKKYSEENNFG
ncbi:uncharacterized protein LOC100181938 [Ciona intestinalis]